MARLPPVRLDRDRAHAWDGLSAITAVAALIVRIPPMIHPAPLWQGGSYWHGRGRHTEGARVRRPL
jgi:hypothetical protein